VNQLLSALRSHLFFPLVVILSPNPLHKNKEESVQVVAAMVCAKCKSSLPPPGLDDSHAEFSIPLIFLFIHKRICLIWDEGWKKLGKDGWNKGTSTNYYKALSITFMK
jgi:hypothetical protein